MLLFTISDAGAVGPENDDVVGRAAEVYDGIVRALGATRCHEVSHDDIVREKALLLANLGSLYAGDGYDDTADAAFAKAAGLFAGAGTCRDRGRLARRRAIHARQRGRCVDWAAWANQAFVLLRGADGPDSTEALEAALDLADAFTATGMHDNAIRLLSESLDLLIQHCGWSSIECNAVRDRLATLTALRVSEIPAPTAFIGGERFATG